MVSLFNSLSQLKDMRIYDFTFGLKKEQIRKQEAGIARKTHEIASLEQSFSQRPKDSTSNSLYKVPFAGHTRANSVRGRNAVISVRQMRFLRTEMLNRFH